MIPHWSWILAQLNRRIWVRATLFSLLAVAAALLGIAVSPYIPADLPAKIGADAVDHILGIIASSMLTVTTFSLSVMVSAYTAASSNVTPRATRLVMEDSTTQNALSTFIGSFLFSLVGIIVLSTGAYGAQGRVVLFGATIVVLIYIVATLLRWIDHLSRLGRVTETTALVEAEATKAMRDRHRHPFMGGTQLDTLSSIPALARPVYSETIGYIQHVDVQALSTLIGDKDAAIYVMVIPGDFVCSTEPLAWVLGLEDDQDEAIRDCYTIGETRAFDQDPRFGVSVLAEIGSKALSSAINDPGTAVDVIGRAVRVLAIWAEPVDVIAPKYPKVAVPGLELSDIFNDIFTPIARDGAGIIEVGLRLQAAFATLSRMEPERFGPPAKRHSEEVLRRSEKRLVAFDLEKLVAASEF